jgi:predicted MFS family arabinose efflux permease
MFAPLTLKRVPLGTKAWFIIISASLFFFYEFLQMTIFNSISESLMQAFHITAPQFGILSAGYFYANVIFLFPAGMALDRFSTRKLIIFGLTLCIFSTVAMASAENFYFALLARFLIGASSTLCFLSAARLASRWFPPQRLAMAIGFVVTMAMLGGFMAQTPMTLLVNAIGWREALLVDAGIGLLFLGIIIKIICDYPPHYQMEHEKNLQQLSSMGFWTSIRRALANLQNWYGGLYTSLLNLSVFIIGSSFGNLYLQQAYHFTKTQASFCSSMIFLGTIIGSPILGSLSDRLGLRRKPMIIAAALSFLLTLPFFFLATPSPWLVGTLIFALGFFTSAQIISYPLIAESNPSALTSTAIGTASVLIMGGGAVFEPLFGYLLNLFWDQNTVNGIAQYSIQNFHHGLIILPVTALISFMVACLAKETYCRFERSPPC